MNTYSYKGSDSKVANCDSRATDRVNSGFLDSIADVFATLLSTGAVVSVRRGVLSIKTLAGCSLPRDVGQAAARSKMALIVHASVVCGVCGADTEVEHAIGYQLTWCPACDVTLMARRSTDRPMGFWVEYAERASCKTCPRVGPTHGGWCMWCLAKREGIDWNERLSEFEKPAISLVELSVLPAVAPTPSQPDLFNIRGSSEGASLTSKSEAGVVADPRSINAATEEPKP